jgi:hypothetical protein
MGVKLRMEFENVEGDQCKVDFVFADYNDEPTIIYGGPRPFVLSEYNSDDNIFKPIRPQIATIEVLASASGVKMEDFLSDNDTDIEVVFQIGPHLEHWKGYLSQDDIEETWIATNHILTLRAYEGIGTLNEAKLVDENGDNLNGEYTFLQFISYATGGIIGSLIGARYICNLYHTSMSGNIGQMGLDQCKTDARTFENNPGEFDDRLTVLEKILRSWNMTIFQQNGVWNIVRIPEYFTDGDLIGFRNNLLNRPTFQMRFDAEVGINERIKPVMPEMLKRVIKPSKETTINFDYDQFNQVLCNESFEEGDFLGSGTITIFGVLYEYDQYDVDFWTHGKGTITSQQPSTKDFYRLVAYKDFQFRDDFVVIQREDSGDSFIKSCQLFLQAGDKIDFSFSYGWVQAGGLLRENLAYVVLDGDDGFIYTLNDDGEWKRVTPPSNTYTALTGFSASNTEWRTYEVESDEIVTSGNLYVYLWKDNSGLVNTLDRKFKDVNFDVIPRLLRNTRRRIKGDYDRYTIQKNVLKNYEDTIFLDDFESKYYKGSILEMDGVTLTGDQWYRRKTFNDTSATSERLTFKRHNALAHWFMNRSYKTKIDANFFGIKWDDGGFGQPIGLLNTIKFVDDAPTKIYMIANLKEIDFMSCTWSATLVEIYDTDVDDNEPTDLDVHSFDYYYE